MDIFKLVGSIFVDTEEANKSISKTDKKAESLGKRLSDGAGKAAKWGAGLVAASTAAAGAVVGLANNAADTADEIDKMSQKIGISTDAYQEWSYVMGQNGMDVEKLSTGMKTLVAQMDSAASGTASAKENFDKLGISIYDASGKLKDQETILNETMHALADMENGTEKSRLATELFGKAGIEMMPMLNQGSAAMDELTQRAHDLGLVMSEDAVAAGVVLGDTMDDVKKSFSMVGTNLGSAVIPIIQKFANLLVNSIPMIQGMVDGFVPVISGLMEGVLPPLMELTAALFPVLLDLIMQLLPPLIDMTEAIIPVIVDMLNLLLPPLIQIIGAILPVLVQILAPLISLLQPIIALLNPIIQLCVALIAPLMQLINAVLPPLINIITFLTEVVLANIQVAFTAMSKVISNVVNVAVSYVKDQFSVLEDIFSGIIEFIKNVFTGNWRGAFDTLKNILSAIFQGMVNVVKTPINVIIGCINGLISGITAGVNGVINALNRLKIDVPDWVTDMTGIKTFGFNLKTISAPQIPYLAEGGDIVQAGTVMVGEAGPELLSLPAGARVTPLDKVGTEIDYDKMAQSFASVLADILPSIIPNYEQVPDETLFQRVRKQSAVNATLGRPGIVV